MSLLLVVVVCEQSEDVSQYLCFELKLVCVVSVVEEGKSS